MEHEYKWAPDLPYMDVRRFIAERLRHEPPSQGLDYEVARYLNKEIRYYSEDLHHYTGNLNATITLIPEGWWWHLSHLEAKIIPTRPIKGAPVSNATLYDFYGAPVGFSAMHYERHELPAALCEALLKAYYDLPIAFVVEASASAHNDYISRMQRYSLRQTLATRKLSKKKSKSGE